MADLVTLYFEGEPSPAEMDSLGELLDSDASEALRFSERALAEARQMRPRTGLFLAAGAAALLLGGAMWVSRARPTRPDLEAGSSSFAAAPPAAVAGAEESPPESAPSAGKPSRAEVQAPASPASAPAAPRRGHRLGVLLKQEEPGQALVSVRDASGRELRRLFQGRLERGSWRFEWDGRLAGGGPAAPGAYRIVVERDGALQEQQVTLRKGMQ